MQFTLIKISYNCNAELSRDRQQI